MKLPKIGVNRRYRVIYNRKPMESKCICVAFKLAEVIDT